MNNTSQAVLHTPLPQMPPRPLRAELLFGTRPLKAELLFGTRGTLACAVSLPGCAMPAEWVSPHAEPCHAEPMQQPCSCAKTEYSNPPLEIKTPPLGRSTKDPERFPKSLTFLSSKKNGTCQYGPIHTWRKAPKRYFFWCF